MERASRRGKKKKKLLGSHQRCWLWGRNVVLEILRAGRWPIAELHLSDTLNEERLAEVSQFAAGHDIPVMVEPSSRLQELCHTTEHQGYLTKMLEFPYGTMDDALSIIREEDAPLFLILDGVQDPYNFGAIVRSGEVLGVSAMLIGERHQVHVTSMVARSSAGAVNRLPIVRVPDLSLAGETLREQGVQLVCASEKAEQAVHSVDLKIPTALVVGNEGTGLSAALLEMCDVHVAIPQHGAIGSLNVAMAATILCYEAQRQRAD